jgi:hypothetical protein
MCNTAMKMMVTQSGRKGEEISAFSGFEVAIVICKFYLNCAAQSVILFEILKDGFRRFDL